MSKFSFITKLRNKIRIKPGNNVKLGSGIRLRYCDIFISGKGNQLILEDGANLKRVCIELIGNGCTIIIGKNCVIGENCLISCRENGTQLTIGEACMFSRNVKVMTSDGHNIIKMDRRINSAKSIHIGKHVWLADNVTILKGASIGENSIVGINSTLTKQIESNIIAVGNPAKVIQHDINWQEELTY